jgi:hypothetical protein
MQVMMGWVILGFGHQKIAEGGIEKTVMEFLLVSVLVLMLTAVAYAQWQRGVVRTIGKLSLDEEETDQTVR